MTANLPMILKADLHIHGVNSGHAYNTLYAIFEEAARKGLRLAALTDHGPAMDGTLGWIHFNMAKRAPAEIAGVRCLWGVELNVIDGDGKVDLPDATLECLDIVLFGFHGARAYSDMGHKANTEAVIRALNNPLIDVLTHPMHPQFPCDPVAILRAALERGVLPELNLSYLRQYGEVHFSGFQLIVDMAKAHGSKLVVNSDAHFLHEIGDESALHTYWDALGLDESMILNADLDSLETWLTSGRRRHQ